MVFGWGQFIGVLTEAFALRLYERLYEPVAQVAVTDGDCTGLSEQRGITLALQTEKATL